MRAFFLHATLLFTTLGWLHAQDEAAGKKFVYKQSGGAPRELEVYFPKDWKAGGAKVPGVLFFHGGGWTGGNRDQFAHACQYFASRGLVAATASYRMLKKSELPPAEGESFKRPCAIDANSAIRWMKQHADELGIDSSRLIVGGGSAGGHLAVLATVNPGLNDPADPKGIDTSVAAYLLFNPAFTVTEKEKDHEVDVFSFVKGKVAPAILFFGSTDSWKPAADGWVAKVKQQGAAPQVFVANQQTHGFFNRQPWADVTLAEADRFLVRLGLLSGQGTLAPPATGERLVEAP